MSNAKITWVAPLLLFGSSMLACASAQTISICKTTVPPGGAGFPFTWSNSFGTQPSFTLHDAQCSAMNIANQDHFNRFTENVPPGWGITGISCNNTTSVVKITGANPNATFELGDETVEIDQTEPNVTCTFVNEKMPMCCQYSQDLGTGVLTQSGTLLWGVAGGEAFATSPVPAWMNMPNSSWIQPVANPTPAPNVPPSTYSYAANFTVPACPNGHVELVGSFAADNSGTALLDGSPIPGATCQGPNCFSPQGGQAPVPINVSPVAPGTHVLQVDVNNQSGYSGLIVSAQVRRVCP